MKKEINIFLDIDGVIADFVTQAELTGISLEKLDYPKMDREWWGNIPVFDGAFDFYQELQKFGKVRFLTAVIMSQDCHSGKADWVVKFADKGIWGLKDLIVCSKRDKPLLAKPKSILIDDNETTIKNWIENGGIGILHKGSFKDSLKQVEQALELL